MFYVYLLASRKQGTLYLGVTKDLVRRTHQHREKLLPGFSSRYDIRRLVWFETYDDPVTAIEREKEIKKWRRAWKIGLIEKDNPDWRDLILKLFVDVMAGFRVRVCDAPRNDGITDSAGMVTRETRPKIAPLVTRRGR